MKREPGRDMSTAGAYPGVFAFELDFGGTLRCIPMSVRLKLDKIGIKLSLQQWNRLPADERRQLVEIPCDELPQIESYRRYLTALIETFAMTAVERMPADDPPEWADPAVLPERIIAWARKVGVSPPSTDEWAALTPLQRFTLFKLTRPGHSNENFIPAMREFQVGSWQTASTLCPSGSKTNAP